jgi:hypothetical protein
MKITIDCDFDAETLSRAARLLEGDLLPWEEDIPDSMERGHGYALGMAIKCLEAIRQGVLDEVGRRS